MKPKLHIIKPFKVTKTKKTQAKARTPRPPKPDPHPGFSKAKHASEVRAALNLIAFCTGDATSILPNTRKWILDQHPQPAVAVEAACLRCARLPRLVPDTPERLKAALAWPGMSATIKDNHTHHEFLLVDTWVQNNLLPHTVLPRQLIREELKIQPNTDAVVQFLHLWHQNTFPSAATSQKSANTAQKPQAAGMALHSIQKYVWNHEPS